MTLAEIKNQVASFFPGMSPDYVKGWVKTNFGDLRKKATWVEALESLQAANNDDLDEYPDELIQAVADALYALPDKNQASVEPESVIVDPVDVILASEKLNSLPLKEIRPGFFIVDHFALHHQAA